MIQPVRLYILWLILASMLTACTTKDIQLVRALQNNDTVSDSNTEGDSMHDNSSDTGTDITAMECALNDQTVRITSFSTSATVIANEEEAALMPIAISPIPSGGSRVAWMGDDGWVHITTLNAADEKVESDLLIAAHDFQDLLATDDGGVILLTRDSEGGGTLNCGDPTNLCIIPDEPVPCYEMYLVRFSMSGEIWATQLTTANAAEPPYSAGFLHYIWWYAHHGRIATNGDSFAAYYGSALSVSSGTCIDIAQGDRMQVVDSEGNLIDGGFSFGCSPSGYERVVWNGIAHAYVSVCKTQLTSTIGAIAFTADNAVIQQVDLWYTNLSDMVVASDGYWMAASMRREGEPENSLGLADVHLYHFSSTQPDIDIAITGDTAENVRAPHLAMHGASRLLLGYEKGTESGDFSEGSKRTFFLQFHDFATGQQIGTPYAVGGITGNRYLAFRSFPDGSVAYPSKGDDATSIKVLRVLPCDEK